MKYDWLESAVFYEVYPTSFYDKNGDGIGDIQGIIEKLGHIRDLGANAIWLNPMFVSPFKDGGYDVADFCNTDKKFGTNADMKELFRVAKGMGITILLDLVMGHTSTEHPWFQASQRHERNEYTDTYIWQPGAEPLSTNNGKAISGIAERRDMFIINFYAMQPALNYGYRKPKAKWQNSPHDKAPMKNRQRVVDVCKFWLEMGAGGFRVDMANHMVKGDTLGKRANIEFWNDVIPRVKKDYPEAVFVSEWFYPTQAVKRSAFDIDFNYGFFLYQVTDRQGFCYNDTKTFLGKGGKNYIPAMVPFNKFRHDVKKKGYQALALGNHDKNRMSEVRSYEMIKATFAFHLTMPHVPFIYYGDEVGMHYQDLVSKDGGYRRTGSRTPMQWDAGKNMGFSTADEIYLPTDNDIERCVSAQEGVDGSILETVRELTHLRRTLKCLRNDACYRVLRHGANPFIFKRTSKEDEAYVVIMPKVKPYSINLGFLKKHDFKQILGNSTLKGSMLTSNGEAFAVFYRKK